MKIVKPLLNRRTSLFLLVIFLAIGSVTFIFGFSGETKTVSLYLEDQVKETSTDADTVEEFLNQEGI